MVLFGGSILKSRSSNPFQILVLLKLHELHYNNVENNEIVT